MTGSESSTGDIFNLDRIRQLIELMKEHDLREIDLRQEEQQIRLCRNVGEMPRMVVGPAAPPPVPAAHPGAVSSAPAPASDDKNIAVIKSPMVGTFYLRPNPNAERFVKEGDRVEADKTVCIIEAMKVFNEIPAEVRGTIVAILVEDGEAVDFGRPLFKVDTSK